MTKPTTPARVFSFTNAGKPIEGPFLAVKERDGAPYVYFMDPQDPAEPWNVLAAQAFATAAERDAALARIEAFLAMVTPAAPVAAPVKPAAPVATKPAKGKPAAPVATVKVTKIPAKPAKPGVTAKPKRSA